MEVTKEHFDEVVSGLATNKGLEMSEARIIARIDEGQEELARMVASGFEDLQSRLDVRDRVQKLEGDMKEIKSALHLSTN